MTLGKQARTLSDTWRTDPWKTDGQPFLVCFFGPEIDIVYCEKGEFRDYHFKQRVWQENSFAWCELPDTTAAVAMRPDLVPPEEDTR